MLPFEGDCLPSPLRGGSTPPAGTGGAITSQDTPLLSVTVN